MPGAHDIEAYRWIIDCLPIAVVTVDAGLRIVGFNPGAEKVTGYSAAEAVGRRCGEVLQGELCVGKCPLELIFSQGDKMAQVETTIRGKGRERVPVRLSIAALLDDAGRLVGGVEAFQDISPLKALEREKANLVSMIGHDMKSCLSVIGGFAQRLLSKAGEIDEEKKHRYLTIIKDQAERLDVLLRDFLEFSRLQAGSLKLDYSATSLDTELLSVLEAFQPKALQRGIEIEVGINVASLSVIEADPERLNRVFANLLDNALKFSREKSKIRITLEETGHDIIVRFRDQGKGIDPRDLPYIFEPFRRGHGRERGEGFGLGLATVKTIVEGHGGKVLVESELGKGTVFTVVLPKEGSRRLVV